MKNSSFKFKPPVLTKLLFVLNQDFFKTGKTVNDISFENKFEVNVFRNPQLDSAMVELVFKAYPSQDKPGPFTVEAAIMSTFSWAAEAGLDQNTINDLLKRNAPALLLGYLRPIVASVTNTPFTPPYHIPFMDFTN